MAYRHCRNCGWGYRNREEWEAGRFCPNCGSRLEPRSSAQPKRRMVEHIEPYADVDPAPKPRLPVEQICGELKNAARSHPFLFGIGAIAVGAGAVMAAPTLVTIGTAVLWIGAIITGSGFLAVAYVDQEESEPWLEAGVLILLGGAAILLAGYTLAILGLCSAAGGVGVAGTATAKELIKWNLKRRLDKMPLAELLQIAQRMDT